MYSKIFSETFGPIKTKFHKEPPCEGEINCMQDQGTKKYELTREELVNSTSLTITHAGYRLYTPVKVKIKAGFLNNSMQCTF